MIDDDMLKGMIAGLDHGCFTYTKENGQDIAPCGLPRRCKSHHRVCIELKTGCCDITRNNRIKSILRLIYDTYPEKGNVKRKKQRLKYYNQHYQKMGRFCKVCQETWCWDSRYGNNPKCGQVAGR